jgi:hypothetical protein
MHSFQLPIWCHYDARTRRIKYAPRNHYGSARPVSPGPIHCPALDFLAALCSDIPDALETEAQHLGDGDEVLTDEDLAQNLLVERIR